MSTTPRTSVIFLELDALLDTRMGTLYRLAPKRVKGIIEKGYLDRVSDFYPGVAPFQFDSHYAKRDRATLKCSMVTPIIDIVASFCKETLSMNVTSPLHQVPKVILNQYPYTLDDSEKQLFLSVLKYRTKDMAEISLVNIPPESLTPRYFTGAGVDMVFMYDPLNWLELHSKLKTFEKEACPTVFMYGPLLLKSTKAVDFTLETYKTAIEQLAGPFVHLEMAPARLFSIFIEDPKNPKLFRTDDKTTESPG